MIPKRKNRPRMGLKALTVIRCPGHLKWVRGFACSVMGLGDHVCSPDIEAAHVRIGTDGGTGMKPSDCYTIPLCSEAHQEQHMIGEQSFEAKYKISMRKIADNIWLVSPHGIMHRNQGNVK